MNPNLRKLLKSPVNPVDPPTAANWEQFEQQWCKLPADFKEFVSEYGTGCIDRFLWIFNPAKGNLSHLFERVKAMLAAYQSEGLLDGISQYPEEGGVVPFGNSDNGDTLAWEARGEPDRWTVIVIPMRDPEYQRFNMGFSDFLVAILKREVSQYVFPDGFPHSDPDFRTPEQMKEFYRRPKR